MLHLETGKTEQLPIVINSNFGRIVMEVYLQVLW